MMSTTMEKSLTDTPPAPASYPDLGQNANLRCDHGRCNAQAFVKAQKQSLVLLFCGHHGKRYEAQLGGEGWDIENKTSLINEKPSISANSEA